MNILSGKTRPCDDLYRVGNHLENLESQGDWQSQGKCVLACRLLPRILLESTEEHSCQLVRVMTVYMSTAV